MKQTLLALLGCLLLSAPPATQSQQYGDFAYSISGSAVTIERYTGSDFEVTIPSTINSLPVTYIGDGAFYLNLLIASVTIPASVRIIRPSAFGSCQSLARVTIGDCVTNIGAGAFIYCGRLANVRIPTSVASIGFRAFSECTSLSAIYVDESNAFYSSVEGVLFNRSQTKLIQYPNGQGRADYTVPNTVTNIEVEAFKSNQNLTSVTIPASVTGIGDSAFASCTRLSSVTISNGVTNIGAGVFAGCYSLSAITVDGLNSSYSSVDGVLFNKSRTTLILYPGGKSGDYALPTSVTNIGMSALAECGLLTSVTLPANVTSIGYRAFASCTSLRGIYFKGNAPSLDLDVFYGDNNTTVYYLPGTTGWGATFGGRPAVLWNPQIPTSSPIFGVRTNRFGFFITGTPNIPVVVEASAGLTGGPWVPLHSLSLTNGLVYFSDPNWTNYPSRLYRLRSP